MMKVARLLRNIFSNSQQPGFIRIFFPDRELSIDPLYGQFGIQFNPLIILQIAIEPA